MAECVGETSHNTEGISGSKRSEMVDDALPAGPSHKNIYIQIIVKIINTCMQYGNRVRINTVSGIYNEFQT